MCMYICMSMALTYPLDSVVRLQPAPLPHFGLSTFGHRPALQHDDINTSTLLGPAQA